ncbi:uncharacterized protein A4U43_C09F16440 [Asparagus officinalis]|uniref:Ribosomal RNA-processing protein 43 n=2 Tax=Asparagus officinalis TaxID=4686 RepID=A0A5P1EBB8_ASPOF|nr:uncharacterized protein A4U43_C09F16440 [Asparagus officinalis]
MEVEAYRRLFPLPYYERHLAESVRPTPASRPIPDTTVAVAPSPPPTGPPSSKVGDTTMLAAIKLEVMTPGAESPDQGSLGIEFHMPPICSPLVRPGRPAEVAPVISKQISDVVMSSGVIDLKELSLINGKAAWMAYLDIYCLNADGSLFDAALLSAIAAFSNLQIPLVSVNEDGRVIAVSGKLQEESKLELVNKEKRKLSLRSTPFSLTCMLHKNYIFADPTAEEESIMDTVVTVVIDSLGRLVSVYKAGGSVLVYNSALQECIILAKKRAEELQKILADALSPQMDLDSD